MIRGLALLLGIGIGLAIASPTSSLAQGEADSQPSAKSPAAPWSAAKPGLAEGVKTRGRLVVHVYVPLCDNDQIVCGSTKAGDPDDLDNNLYWGAVFGHRRFFGRSASGFDRIALEKGEGVLLQRAVFRRSFDGKPWDRKDAIDLYVVLDAIRGDAIDDAVDRFFKEAETGGSASFEEEGRTRTLEVDVVGYAGHNGMMDGKEPPKKSAKQRPIPSFVMACRSSQYFAKPLADRGSETLLMTRDLMAPEGYVVHAIATSLAQNTSKNELRARTVRAYATWQKIEDRVAGSIFAKP
ncbi:MAG: hypothetical protein HOW73_28125 [Polyangiaceae bacterium]|nr:hypothetical protein [Polyangiaceae bacterium]